MTPKEKAEDLVSDYHVLINPHEIIHDNYNKAKQCALIAVDEIINSHNGIKDFLFSEIGYLITSPEYWQEVKSEIEKL